MLPEAAREKFMYKMNLHVDAIDWTSDGPKKKTSYYAIILDCTAGQVMNLREEVRRRKLTAVVVGLERDSEDPMILHAHS